MKDEQQGELSEQDLEAVAGGGGPPCLSITPGAGQPPDREFCDGSDDGHPGPNITINRADGTTFDPHDRS